MNVHVEMTSPSSPRHLRSLIVFTCVCVQSKHASIFLPFHCWSFFLPSVFVWWFVRRYISHKIYIYVFVFHQNGKQLITSKLVCKENSTSVLELMTEIVARCHLSSVLVVFPTTVHIKISSGLSCQIKSSCKQQRLKLKKLIYLCSLFPRAFALCSLICICL